MFMTLPICLASMTDNLYYSEAGKSDTNRHLKIVTRRSENAHGSTRLTDTDIILKRWTEYFDSVTKSTIINEHVCSDQTEGVLSVVSKVVRSQ